jgi:AcrR family transcriptional regulator
MTAGGNREDTRTRILKAANQLFSRDGFDNTTVRAIAARVKLSDAALYYYFKSKREILQAIWDVPGGPSPGRLRPDGPLTRERLAEIVDTAIDFAVRNRDFLRLVNREVLLGDQTALALRQENRAFLRRTLYEHFLTVFDAPEAEPRAEAALAIITGSTIRREIQFGRAFPSAAGDPDYRRTLRDQVAAVAQLPLPQQT